MRSIEEIDSIMKTIPVEWRERWCGAENGACACMGCVQIGNRMIMAKKTAGQEYCGDPEYIDERKINQKIYKENKITKEEWERWLSSQDIE
jgi:hypothetical protein